MYIKWGSQQWKQCRTPRLADPNIEYRVKISRVDPSTLTVYSPHWYDKRFRPTVAITPVVNTVASSSFAGKGTLEHPYTVADSSAVQITLSGIKLALLSSDKAKISVYLTNKLNRVVNNGTIT